MLDHGRQVGVVYTLIQVSEHSLVLSDVVDDGDNETHGVLVWRQLDIGPSELKEYKDLLLVTHEAGLANWEHIGREGWDGQTEGDGPLELVLSHKLRLQLIPHQLYNILQNLSGAIEETTEATQECWSVWRSNNLQRKKTDKHFDDTNTESHTLASKNF